MSRKERVINRVAFANGVRLEQVEADVVEIAEIFSARKHFLFINLNPLVEGLPALRSQVEFVMLGNQFGQHKLGSDDSTHTNCRSEIGSAVAQFHVIAKIWNVVAHKSF